MRKSAGDASIREGNYQQIRCFRASKSTLTRSRPLGVYAYPESRKLAYPESRKLAYPESRKLAYL